MGNKYSTKQTQSLKTNKTCIYQVVQLNNVELATCSSERNIDIWNLETGLIDITLTGYTTPVTQLVYMHDGRLATGSMEKSIRIWTYDNHRCDFNLMAHDGPIRALIQLKNYNLASGSDDKTIRILDIRSTWFSARFEGHTGSVRALAELLDERLVSGSDDKTIKIWNVKTKKLEGSIDIGNKVTSLLVVNKSGLLCVGAKKIKVFNMNTPETYVNVFDLPGHHTDVNIMINVGVDGERIVSGATGTVKIWNIKKKTLENQLEAHKKGTYGMEIMTDGRLVTSGGDGELKVWNILGDKGQFVNLKTGKDGDKVEDEKEIVVGTNVGKVTYAIKDDVKRHDLNAIEKNIGNKGSVQNKNSIRSSWNPFSKKNTVQGNNNKNTITNRPSFNKSTDKTNNATNKTLKKSNSSANLTGDRMTLQKKGWEIID